MYLTILKKDVKRKKTMNLILLVFVILAATFIASSVNNLVTVSNALDDFFDKANVPDYWFISTNASDMERFREFAGQNGYDYYTSRLTQIEPKNVLVEGDKLEYSNTLVLSALGGGMKIFDMNNEELTQINDGEIYVSTMFQSSENDFHEGGKIVVQQGGMEKEFTIKGYTKDVLFGSAMAGVTRFLISKHDAELLENENASISYSVEVHTKDADYLDKFNALNMNSVIAADYSGMKMMYFMDVLMAAVLLVVSVCLILISMVILRFIINFTIVEEYREIGVMKAIGIKSSAIRGLYIMKYLAISVMGTVIGLVFSFPFGKLMIGEVSKKIIIAAEENALISIGAAVLAGIIVVLFSYFCTRRIRKFSPIDAIRSGETGERFRKKGFLHLGKTRMAVVPFMALNDILSGMKSYVSMILIFIIGTLLVIIPVNTINTLRSDKLVTMFNMAKCDHVISMETLFASNEDNTMKVEKQFSEIKDMFSQNGIEVDVFQEVIFGGTVSKGDHSTKSLSFQGFGDVTTDQYTYIKGMPPQNAHEVALSYITAGHIGAEIGDDVKINLGETTRTYTVTAINQSMNNMGESVRFHPDEELDDRYAVGSFGIQVSYKDSPDEAELDRRMVLLERLYPDAKVYTSGEYISYMIGDVAGQFDSMKILILIIILGINALVAVLMVKSFITRERREIALLKAIGFGNRPLILIQIMRIGVVLLISVIAGALMSLPLSTLIIEPIFQMMGAYSIEFEIRAVEVYGEIPFIMLVVTALSAFISAQGLRKISSSEMSDIE